MEDQRETAIFSCGDPAINTRFGKSFFEINYVNIYNTKLCLFIAVNNNIIYYTNNII